MTITLSHLINSQGVESSRYCQNSLLHALLLLVITGRGMKPVLPKQTLPCGRSANLHSASQLPGRRSPPDLWHGSPPHCLPETSRGQHHYSQTVLIYWLKPPPDSKLPTWDLIHYSSLIHWVSQLGQFVEQVPCLAELGQRVT